VFYNTWKVILVGGAISFTCPYRDEPPAWSFKNSNAKNNHEVIINPHYSTLIIYPVTTNYSGKIHCAASPLDTYALILVGKVTFLLITVAMLPFNTIFSYSLV